MSVATRSLSSVNGAAAAPSFSATVTTAMLDFADARPVADVVRDAPAERPFDEAVLPSSIVITKSTSFAACPRNSLAVPISSFESCVFCWAMRSISSMALVIV